LECHIAERVDTTQQNHWTLRFTRDNLPPMAAAMCIVGHIVDNRGTYSLDECLLQLPITNLFQIILGDRSWLEGCYLYYNTKKNKWIRSGKTSGDEKDACFRGSGMKHDKNAALKEEMRIHPFYRKYPRKGVGNIGALGGYFYNLGRYCGMAFYSKGYTTPLFSDGKEDCLFIWSRETIDTLKKEGR